MPAGPSYADTTLLDVVRAPGGWGVFASVGPNFQHTVFGRDSIEVAEDVYEYDQQLAHDVIITLGRLQGTQFSIQNEEEPGKILHEYRTTNFAGQVVPEHTLGLMRKLMEERGETPAETMLHYDTFDATPLYIRLVQKYTDRYGDGILSEAFTNKDGDERTVWDSVVAATDWLVGKLQQRDDRLLAYRRMNGGGPDTNMRGSIENQIWKDSRTSHLFSDGTLPNFNHDVVSIELQGYTYDALLYAARLFPALSDKFMQLAGQVQKSTLGLWMPEEQYFAQGIATHYTGEERLLDTLTSDGALILDSKLLADLPETSRDMFVNGIEKMIMGPEFATRAGIRCRALRHANLLPFVDYHGSLAVWAKETKDIAAGLGNYGRIAGDIALRQTILRSFQTAGNFYELFYADTDGTVYYDPLEGVARFSSPTAGEPLPVPEPGQAWSISAAISSAYVLHNYRGSLPSSFFRRAMRPGRVQIPRQPTGRIRVPSFTSLLLTAQSALLRRRRP